MEYALVKAGIPALTLELGGSRGFEPEMVRVGVEGIENVLAAGTSASEALLRRLFGARG
jgi:predicted deacylase